MHKTAFWHYFRKSIFQLALSFLIVGACFAQGRVTSHEKKMWFYFDLGDTLIDAKDMNHLHYFPRVREYLRSLKSHGLRIGLITNIPETWGASYAQKLAALKKTIAQGWAEREAFEWEVFDEIILPMKDTERKPAPTLFLQAISHAERCPSAFVSESVAEVEAARQQGMAIKLFSPQDRDLFVRPERAREFLIKNYKLRFDSRCMIGI